MPTRLALLLILLVFPPQDSGLSDSEKKDITAVLQNYFDAPTPEERAAASRKLESYRPSKSDLETLLAQCVAIFRKSGPLHDGRSPATCGHAKYPGKYLITLPEAARRGEKTGVFISLHGGGAGVGDAAQIQNLFGVPAPGLINVYPTVCEKTESAWNSEREEQYVLAILDELKRTYVIDTNRIYLAGHSMGGYGTWSIGGRHADLFAALSSMAGSVQIGRTPIDGGVITNLLNTPIWFFHSTDDPQVPADGDIRAAEALQKLKSQFGPYDYVWKLYNDIGHGFPKDGIKPIFEWMTQKTRDPLPKHVRWESGRAYKRHFYWLKRTGGGGPQIEAKREGNRISVTGPTAGLTILLNDRMVDFSKPVIVEANGREVFNDGVARNAAALVETFESRHDPDLTFTAWIKLRD